MTALPIGLLAELMEVGERMDGRIDRIELMAAAAEKLVTAVRTWRDALGRDAITAAEWGILTAISDYEAALAGEFDPRMTTQRDTPVTALRERILAVRRSFGAAFPAGSARTGYPTHMTKERVVALNDVEDLLYDLVALASSDDVAGSGERKDAPTVGSEYPGGADYPGWFDPLTGKDKYR